MPIEIFYDGEARLLRVIGERVVTMEDRHKSVRQLLEEPGYSDESDVLIDVSGISNAPANFRGVANLIRMLRTRYSGRIGIVNVHAGHVTISNLIALEADLSQNAVGVFASESEATAWFKA